MFDGPAARLRPNAESRCRIWAKRCGVLQRWIDQLRWQRLPSFEELAQMLLDHLDGTSTIAGPRSPWG